MEKSNKNFSQIYGFVHEYSTSTNVPEGDGGRDVYVGLGTSLVDDNISLYTVSEGDGGCDVYVGLGTSLMDDNISPGLGICSFQKNVPFFAFFSVLLKRTFCSLRSFPFF